jgi:serine/threonine protein kinase
MQQINASYLCFIRCRPAIVSHFNMVADFGGPGEVLSLYGPYVCPDCDEHAEILLDLRKQHAQLAAGEVPPLKCKRCGGAMDFDEFPGTYLALVNDKPIPNPPPAVRAVLDGESGSEQSFKIIKQVEGNVTALWVSGPLDDERRLKRVGDGLQDEVLVVLAGVSRASEEGLQALRQLGADPGVQLSYARLPLPVAAQLARSPPLYQGAAIVSVMLPAKCKSCGQRRSIEIDPATASKGEPGSVFSEPCACGGRLLLDAPKAELTPLKQLPATRPKDVLLQYLRAHPTPPSRTRETPKGEGNSPQTREAPAVSPGGGDRLGDYEILGRIGVGGMGEVLRARKLGPEGFKKVVVLKRILPQFANDPQWLEMFLHEAKIAARISHPNVVQILDLGRIDGEYVIAMEYVAGRDLAKIIAQSRRRSVVWPIELASWVAAEIAGGLAAAHEHRDDNGELRSIVHRDVSPHNVLVSKDGAVKLGDFGVAKVADPQHQTSTQMLKGKLGYLAPERLTSKESSFDPRIDVFSAGVILWECLTGGPLLSGENEALTIYAIVNYKTPELTSRRADAPQILSKILRRALEKEPAQRYPNARAMRSDLERFIAGYGRAVSADTLARWVDELFAAGEPADAGANSSEETTVKLTHAEIQEYQRALEQLEKARTRQGRPPSEATDTETID